MIISSKYLILFFSNFLLFLLLLFLNEQFIEFITLGVILNIFVINTFDNSSTTYNNITKIRKYQILIFALLGFYLLITQNNFLHYEIISIDIPSYLVASQHVSFDNLPFESQWESKGPLFIYFYKLIQIFSGKSLVVFKILNDFLLFVIVIFLYLTALNLSKDHLISIGSSLFFISIVSHEWYVGELSELYCLIFLSIVTYISSLEHKKKFHYTISLLLLSLSTLINQSTIIFFLSYLVYYFLYIEKYNLKKLFRLIFIFSTPHIFFLVLYIINGLLDIYLINYIFLTFGYVQEGRFEFTEVIIWLKRMFIFNRFLFYSIFLITISVLINFLTTIKEQNNKTIFIIFNIFASVLIYIIGGHNYVHHLYYFIFFISLGGIFLLTKFTKYTFLAVVILAASQIWVSTFSTSIYNLSNIEKIQNEYPLYSLSQEIKINKKEYNTLAFDHLLLLFYLDKDNESYIIHPFNNFEEYIVELLINSGKLKSNEFSHFSYYVETEPDLIVCNPRAIVLGVPTRLDGKEYFNCEISDYKKNYIKVDTTKFNDDPNFHFYNDPYREISLFIKILEKN
tara:strand:- start:171 stop:1871 length:1701 start_codon:yes stop_codon:yes gene_type:complete